MGIQASRSNAISLQVTIEEYFRDNNLDEEIIDYDFGNGAFTEWHFYCDGDDFKYIDDNILYDYIADLREFRDENFEVFSFRDEISVKILDDEFEESKESVRKSMKESKESDLIDSVATKLRKEKIIDAIIDTYRGADWINIKKGDYTIEVVYRRHELAIALHNANGDFVDSELESGYGLLDDDFSVNYVIDFIKKFIKERNYLKKEFSIKESINESKIKAITDYREIKVFLDGHTEPSKKYQTYDFNRYGKKYEINGITENKDDVTLTFERGKLKSFTYLGDTENFDKENNATHFSNAMDKGWICEFNNNGGSNNDEYTITFRLQLFEFI